MATVTSRLAMKTSKKWRFLQLKHRRNKSWDNPIVANYYFRMFCKLLNEQKYKKLEQFTDMMLR